MSPAGRILIVDDEEPVREVLTEYFAGQGYTVESAGGGAEALEAAGRTRPDLVLLDVRMPGMDGVQVLRRLRERHPGLAVIMITANEDVALARQTLQLGAFDYVAKPFDFDYLDRAVAAALVHASPAGAGMGPPPGDDEPWRRLAAAVFRAVRGMDARAQPSLGARLEAAALDAAAAARAGRSGTAAARLAEIDLLLGIAVELGDLAPDARRPVDALLGAARQHLPGP
jgi:two-component system response regulator (stage 0 sporulation protein F)